MLKKIFYLIVISIIIFIASSFSPNFKPTFAIKTVVIDAGHGGKDPGCHGSLYKEKDIALAVALKLGKYIEENMKDVKVIYTRKTDIFVELQERAMIANRAKADLFICVHCNSACVRDKVKKKDICRDQVHGAETYVMGIKNEKGKLDVAKRENSAILLEDDYVQKYQGFDPNSDESYIIMSMFNDTYLNQSLSFAAKAQKQYAGKAGREDHGVKRASLWVLWRTYMPSVLTEIGYLTNKREELFLGSEKGQDYIASGLFRAFREYKDELEGTAKKYNDDIENQEPYHLTKEDSLEMVSTAKQTLVEDTITGETETAVVTKEEVKAETVVAKKEDTSPKSVVEKKKEEKKEEPKPLPISDRNKDDIKQVAINTKKETKVEPVIETKKEEKKEVVSENRKENKIMQVIDKPVENNTEPNKSANTETQPKTPPVAEKRKDEPKPAPPIVEKKKEEVLVVKQEEPKPTPPVVEKKKEEVVAKKEVGDRSKPETDKTNKVIEPKKETPVAKKEPAPDKKQTEVTASNAAIVYKVQFLSSPKKYALTSDKFKGIEKPWEYEENETYKYTAGEFATKKEAVALQNEMRKTGYTDAFVISTQDGKRIPFK